MIFSDIEQMKFGTLNEKFSASLAQWYSTKPKEHFGLKNFRQKS